jgi:decaprenyl-phosphate phosphoribosyltransferase
MQRPGFLCGSLLRACRPQQWTKNLLAFAAPLFAFRFEEAVWLAATGAFVAFCLISSAIYLFNDSVDVEADRAHPTKRLRPIASGEISVPTALGTALVLAMFGFGLAWFININLAGIIFLYALVQLAYCLAFKRVPLLDLFCIASGFLLRAIAGVISGGLVFSPWFLLTVGLLALFLAVEKRKAELRIFDARGQVTRRVLQRYSLPLLLRLESLVANSAFITYSLWASGPALNGAPTSWMLLTVPFVLVGIFRYQLLSDPDESDRRKLLVPSHTAEKPEDILFRDPGIQLTLFAWLVTVSVIGASHHARLLPTLSPRVSY